MPPPASASWPPGGGRAGTLAIAALPAAATLRVAGRGGVGRPRGRHGDPGREVGARAGRGRRPAPRRLRRAHVVLRRRRHRRARLRLLRRATSPRRRRARAASPACSRCSPGRCSAWSWPTTCSCSTASGSSRRSRRSCSSATTTRERRGPGRRAAGPAGHRRRRAGACSAGFVLLGQAAGTYRLSEHRWPTRPAAPRSPSALVLVLVGAFTKSAQYPFHSWLPGAMVAPTPVSAYLHSATMVKAGVYLVARFAPAFAGVGVWRPLVRRRSACVTMVARRPAGPAPDTTSSCCSPSAPSASSASWSCCSASGTPAAHGGRVRAAARPRRCSRRRCSWSSASLDHQAGTRDLRAPPAPRAAGGAPVAVVTVVRRGVDGRRAAALRVRGQGGGLRRARPAAVRRRRAGARRRRRRLGADRRLQPPLRRGALARPPARTGDPPAAPASRRRPAPAFLAPAAVLAALTARARASCPGSSTGSSARPRPALDPARRAVHLALWHGVNLPLAAVGRSRSPAAPCLFVAGAPVAPVLAAGRADPDRRPTSTARSLRGAEPVADRVTGVVQTGSLPVYTGVILAHRRRRCPAARCCVRARLARLAGAGRARRATCRSSRRCSVGRARPPPAVRRRFSAALLPRRGRLRHGRRCSSCRARPTWRSPRWPSRP